MNPKSRPKTGFRQKNQDELSQVKAELNKGKVYMSINVLNPVELRRKILMKDPIQANKTERYRSVVENSNEFLKKIKRGEAEDILEDLYEDIVEEKEFSDCLSDLSVSVIELKDNFKDVMNINELLDASNIQQLQKTLQENPESYLPKDYSGLKAVLEDLRGKLDDLRVKYNEALNGVNTQNEELRSSAQKTYEEYKQMRKALYKGRKILKEKRKISQEKSKYSRSIL